MYKKQRVAFLFLIIAVTVMATYFLKNNALHLKINQLHSPFFDIFFKWITHLGDGLLFIFLAVIEIFKIKKLPINTAIAALLTLITVALCKHVIFSGEPRPISFFSEENLHLVADIKMAHWNSFPSGHSTTAFVIYILLLQWTKNKTLKILCVTLAVLAAFSRVYLSQHFLIDIVAGAFLGTSIALYSPFISQYFFRKIYKVSD